MKHHYDQMNSDFVCKHCNNYVTTDPVMSGVNNRNHCPYCLWSRHMDFYEPGDRLAACKMEMRPIGLTLKRSKKKYGQQQGELMIIHQCVDCDKVSINRIAADDDNDTILEIFERSQRLPRETAQAIEMSGVTRLGADDAGLVRARLYGWSAAMRSEELEYA